MLTVAPFATQITFIFLPLTFIVSFFGMNVNIFGGADGDAYPNVGWYFLAAVILMIFGKPPLLLITLGQND